MLLGNIRLQRVWSPDGVCSERFELRLIVHGAATFYFVSECVLTIHLIKARIIFTTGDLHWCHAFRGIV